MSLNIDDFIVENLFSRKINEFFRKNEDKSFFFCIFADDKYKLIAR
jgi:hypothetical protein